MLTFLYGSASSKRSDVQDAVSRVLAQTQLFEDSFTGFVKVMNKNKVTGNMRGN